MMKYIELTIEEAMQRCEKNAKVFVAIRDLKDTNTNVSFVKKERKDYLEIFEDMQTADATMRKKRKSVRCHTGSQGYKYKC